MFHVKHFCGLTGSMKSAIATSDLSQNVSRETFLALQNYVALLQKWNKAINLIGKSTEQEIWQRHIEDSLQLLPLIPSRVTRLADMGSGAGIPGLVIAIAKPEIHITLIEQDQRKSAFLREAAATLGLKNVTVRDCAIEKVDEIFDLITARALASLEALCALAYPRLAHGAICLFPKGKNFAIELQEASKKWQFKHGLKTSSTQDDSSIITLTELAKRKGSNL